MREVLWTEPAEDDLAAFLNYLPDRNTPVAARAEREIEALKGPLGTRTLPGRSSLCWRSLRELSIPDWHKVLVLQVGEDLIRVIAFVDQRQDLDALTLPSDDQEGED